MLDFTPRIHKDILKAQQLILEQKYQYAISIYERILKESPEDKIKVKIYYQLGELFSINLSKNKKAVYYYSKIQKVTADPLWLVKSEERIGEVSFRYLRDYEQSYKSYKKLSSFKPRLKNFDFYEYRMALSLLNAKKYAKSAENLSRISKIKNHSYALRSMYQLGHLYFEQKKWNDAISIWNNYLEFEQKREHVVRTKFLLANAYETIEELKKAYDLYYSILGDYPHTEVVQARLKSIYSRRVARKR
jgi:tetratricopeptide (TPR) repeat protein